MEPSLAQECILHPKKSFQRHNPCPRLGKALLWAPAAAPGLVPSSPHWAALNTEIIGLGVTIICSNKIQQINCTWSIFFLCFNVTILVFKTQETRSATVRCQWTEFCDQTPQIEENNQNPKRVRLPHFMYTKEAAAPVAGDFWDEKCCAGQVTELSVHSQRAQCQSQQQCINPERLHWLQSSWSRFMLMGSKIRVSKTFCSNGCWSKRH